MGEQLEFGFPLTDGDHDASILRGLTRRGAFGTVKHAIKRLMDRRTSAYELLSRPPLPEARDTSEFLRYCAAHGVLTVVDLHCLRRCAEASRSLPPGIIRHVNLFPSTLAAASAARVLDAFGAQEAGDFCLELNEDFSGIDPRALVAPVRALRRAGVRIAIDDVGFGKSCLEGVLLLEPDVIKADRSLVTGLSEEPARARALERLLRMAHAAGARVIAEGIEREEDLAGVRRLGIDYGQGYLWGKPE